jgi:hypothetical protein
MCNSFRNPSLYLYITMDMFDFISFNILELQKKSNPFPPYILNHRLSQIHHITTQYQLYVYNFMPAKYFSSKVLVHFYAT